MLRSLFLILILFGCQTYEFEDEFHFLALGDSYTIGESVAENVRWPYQLARKINESNSSVRIIAKTGWTTDELISAIEDANIKQQYNLVSLLIGVNNQYRGWPIQTFESELQELIEIAVSFSKKGSSNVIVLSIPDWSAFPFAEGRDINKITGEIDDFNAIVKRTAQENGVLFFDITDISRLASEQPELIAEDLLHPSGEMYRLWVEKIINSKEFQEIDF